MPNNNEGISTRIGVMGDKEYKAALSDIGRQLRVLNSDMKSSQSAFGDQSGSMEALQDKLSKLGAIYDAQSEKVRMIRERLESAIEVYGENSRQADDLRIALNNATTQMNTTANQMRDTESQIGALSEKEEEAAKDTGELGEALKDEGKKADDAEKKSGALNKALQGMGKATGATLQAGLKATAAALGAMATAAGNAIKNGFEFAQAAGAYADDVGTLSVQTGISTEKLQEWSYASNFIDTSVDTMTGSMTKLLNNMNSAAGGSESAMEKFSQLGVSFQNADGSLRGTEDVFWDAIDALGKIDNEAERDAMAMELFGKSAKELNPLIEAGSEAWKEMGQEAHKSSIVMSEDQLALMGAFDDTMQRYNQQADALKRIVGVKLIPAFDPLVNKVTSAMRLISRGLNREGMGAAYWEVVIGAVIETLSEALDDIINMINDALPMITEVVGALIRAVAAKLPALVDVLLPGAFGLLQSVIDSVVQNIGPLAELATSLVTGLAGFLMDNIPAIMDAAIDLVDGLLDGIIEALPELIPAGIEMVVKLATGLVEAIPRLVEKLPEIVKAIWDGLSNVDWLTLGGEILGSILDALGGLGEGLKGLFDAGLQLITGMDFSGIWDAITGALSGLGEWFSGLFSSAKDALSGLDFGWDGIGTAVEGALGGVGTWFSGLFDTAKGEAEKLSWSDIGDKVVSGVESYVGAGASFLSGAFEAAQTAIQKIDWGAVGTAIGDGVNGVIDVGGAFLTGNFEAAKAAIEAIDWAGLGTKIGECVTKLGELGLDAISGVFDAGKGAIEAFPWEAVGTDLGTLAGQITELPLKTLSGVFDAGAAAIEAFPWEAVGTELGTLAGQITELSLKTLSGVFDAGAAAIEAFPWEAVGTDLGTLAGQITELPLKTLSGVFDAGAAAIEAFPWEAVGTDLGELAGKVTAVPIEALGAAFETAAQVIQNIDWAQIGNDIADGLNRAWGIVSGIGDVALGLGEAGVMAGQQGVGALKEWVAGWRGDTGVAGEAEKTGEKIITDIGTGVAAAVPSLETTAGDAAGALLKAITDVLTEEALNAIGMSVDSYLMGGMEDGKSGETGLIAKAESLADEVYDALREEIDWCDFPYLGQMMDEGIRDGINNYSHLIESAARDAAWNAYLAAKEELGVASPSKEGMWLGEMFAEGMARGISGNADAVMQAAAQLGDLAIGETAGGFAGFGSARSGSGVDYGAIRDAMAEAIEVTGAGRSVISMDGRIVGETVEPYSSRAGWQRQQRTVSGRALRLVMG